jgi:hypothetical protein
MLEAEIKGLTAALLIKLLKLLCLHRSQLFAV